MLECSSRDGLSFPHRALLYPALGLGLSVVLAARKPNNGEISECIRYHSLAVIFAHIHMSSDLHHSVFLF
jgi:hypothetical protein